MFVLRDFATIAAGMLAHLSALTDDITDYTEGAVARSFLETLAIELQRMDYAVYQGVRDGIETGTYKNFAFGQLPAVPATGTVRYTRAITNVVDTVPIGHTTGVPGTSRRYQTMAATTFAIGEAVKNIAVRATQPGTDGNTPANTIVEVVDGLGFAVTVTNPAPFLSGLAEETPEARRERFRLYIAGLSRGTKIALEFAARSVVLTDASGNVIERVAAVLVREPFLEGDVGLGLVQVYVDNGAGNPSAALLAKVNDVLRGTVDLAGVITPGWIAAGIDLDVFGVTPVTITVTGTITVAVGFDKPATITAVTTAITQYIQGLPVFKPVVHAELISAAMNVDGVVDVAIAEPSTNVLTTFSQRAIPGVVTITAP
jgi:phage-related baseplate assembly protein